MGPILSSPTTCDVSRSKSRIGRAAFLTRAAAGFTGGSSGFPPREAARAATEATEPKRSTRAAMAWTRLIAMAMSTPFMSARDAAGAPFPARPSAVATVFGMRAIGIEGDGHQHRPGGRRAEAAADQAVAEPGAAAGLAALDRADRPAKLPRGLLVREALEVAEDHGRSIAVGELAQLLVDHERRDCRRGIPPSEQRSTRPAGARGRVAASIPTGRRRRCGGPPDGARGRASRGPRASGPCGPGRGRRPGRRPRPRARRGASRGRPARPSARAARRAPAKADSAAPSSPRPANRSRSGPSARPAAEPPSKTALSPRKTAPADPCPTCITPRPGFPQGYE